MPSIAKLKKISKLASFSLHRAWIRCSWIMSPIGIDLDHCIVTLVLLSSLAAEIIGYGESYAERSPSGEGIRIFVRGKDLEGAEE